MTENTASDNEPSQSLPHDHPKPPNYLFIRPQEIPPPLNSADLSPMPPTPEGCTWGRGIEDTPGQQMDINNFIAKNAKTELGRLLDELNELPIANHDQELAEKIHWFFDEVQNGRPSLALIYFALLHGSKLGKNPIAINAIEDSEKRIIAAIEKRERRQVEETRRLADAANVAVRGYQKMEAVAQEAITNPLEAALDIYSRMPMNDEARAVREAIISCGSIRKAAKKLGMNYSKARRIVQNQIIPAYAKAGIPPERVFLMRPSIGYSKAPLQTEEGDDPNNAPERDLYQQGAPDTGERES